MRVPKFAAGTVDGGRYTTGRVVQAQVDPQQQAQTMAQGLARFGAGIGALGEKLQDEVDEAEVQAAANLFDDYTRTVLDPMKGYRSQVGQAAKDSYESTVQDLEAKRQEFGARLKNSRQRELYERYSRSRSDRTRGAIDSHAAQEVRAYNVGEKQAAVAGKMTDYVGLTTMDKRDPQAEQRALLELKQAVGDLADLSGVGPEQRKQLIEDAVYGARENAVGSLIDLDRLDEAERAIASDEFDPAKRSGYTAKLKNRRDQLARKAELEADKQRAQELDQELQNIVRGTENAADLSRQAGVQMLELDDDAPSWLRGSAALPQYRPDVTPAQRGMAIRERARTFVDKEQNAGRMTAAEAASFLQSADGQVRAITNRYLENGAAAFETAMEALIQNPQLTLQQLPNFEDVVRYGQARNVQERIDEDRATRMKPVLDAIEAQQEADMQALQDRRDEFAGVILEQLASGARVGVTQKMHDDARALGLSLETFPVDSILYWGTATEKQIRGIILGLGVTKKSDFLSYYRKALGLQKQFVQGSEDARQAEIDVIKDQVAYNSNIDLTTMRRTSSAKGYNFSEQMKIKAQYNRLLSYLNDFKWTAQFGVNSTSSPEEWKKAMPGMIDALTIGGGLVTPENMESGRTERTFGSAESLSEQLGISRQQAIAIAQARLKRGLPTTAGDLEREFEALRAGEGNPETVKAIEAAGLPKVRSTEEMLRPPVSLTDPAFDRALRNVESRPDAVREQRRRDAMNPTRGQ